MQLPFGEREDPHLRQSATQLNDSERRQMSAVARAVIMLIISNTFMTFAWYAHLRNLGHRHWIIAALASWAIALLEYLFQVPGNRIGYTVLSLSQLKIIQEVITLLVFVPFAILYMRQAWSWNYLWAAFCIMGAVYFIFRDPAKPEDSSVRETQPEQVAQVKLSCSQDRLE